MDWSTEPADIINIFTNKYEIWIIQLAIVHKIVEDYLLKLTHALEMDVKIILMMHLRFDHMVMALTMRNNKYTAGIIYIQHFHTNPFWWPEMNFVNE